MQQVQVGPVAYSGFPVRSLTKKLNGEGGEWITAYRVEQKKRFTTTISRAQPERSLSRAMRPPTNTREASGSLTSRAPTLNKEFLLSHCYVSDPSDLSVANISGSELENYVPEDLAQFQDVIHVDAADNKLMLEAFTHFPSLEGLEQPLNGLVDVQLSLGDFPHLTSLDLSYNILSGLAVIDLGLLPVLRELHLTGNNLVALPIEMTRPYKDRSGDYSMRFPALENLWLDDNKLSDQTTFASLAGLRRLKYLNLDNNEIYLIPQLKLLGASPLKHKPPTTIYTPPHSTEDNLTSTGTLESNTHETGENSEQTEPLDQRDKKDISLQEGDGLNQPVSTSESSETQSEMTSQPPIHAPLNTVERMVATPQSKSEVTLTVSGAVDQLPKCKSSSEVLEKNTCNQSAQDTSANVDRTELTRTTSVEVTDIENGPTLQSTESSSNHVSTNDEHILPDSVEVDTREALGLSEMTQNDSSDVMATAPFPALETLSLVNNLILSGEGIVACESWPALKKLLIYDNPFVSVSKGIPPLLKLHLIDQCGIKVVRKQPSSTHKHLIGRKVKDFKKVSSAAPPPIPKCPLPAIEPPTLDSKMIGYSPSVTGTHSSQCSFSPDDSNSSLGSVLDDDGEDQAAGVFMTQVEGEEPVEPSTQQPVEATQTSSLKDEYEARLSEVRERYKDVPQKYKGYELLLDVHDDPHSKIPSDIHSCVRALKYSLKHPLALGGKPPPALSIASSSSSTVSQLTGNYLKKKTPPLDPLPPVKTHGKVREIRGVLDDLRTHCTTLETNLSQALTPHTPPQKKTISQLQKESRQLLAEMQACYDKVRASSLKSVQSLIASEERNRLHTGRRSGTPRRVKFSRDRPLLTPSSPGQ